MSMEDRENEVGGLKAVRFRLFIGVPLFCTMAILIYFSYKYFGTLEGHIFLFFTICFFPVALKVLFSRSKIGETNKYLSFLWESVLIVPPFNGGPRGGIDNKNMDKGNVEEQEIRKK